MRISSRPKISSRYSLTNRSFSGISFSSVAPTSTPSTVPMPPSTMAASRNADSRNTYWSGVTETSTWALTAPATPARNAPPANANSLRPKTLTPIASAAFSSSRMATQPRPIRLLLSRTKTRMTNASSTSSRK